MCLAVKTVLSREVREGGKAAAATLAARLSEKMFESDGRVVRARRREKMRAAELHASRPEAMYGDAVKHANLRRAVKGIKSKKSRLPPL